MLLAGLLPLALVLPVFLHSSEQPLQGGTGHIRMGTSEPVIKKLPRRHGQSERDNPQLRISQITLVCVKLTDDTS